MTHPQAAVNTTPPAWPHPTATSPTNPATTSAVRGEASLGVMLRSAVGSLHEGHMPLAEIGLSVAIKLAVMPIVAFVLVKFVFSMTPVWATVTVVMAVLPNAATVFVLTQQYKTYVQESTAAVVASTAGAATGAEPATHIAGTR